MCKYGSITVFNRIHHAGKSQHMSSSVAACWSRLWTQLTAHRPSSASTNNAIPQRDRYKTKTAQRVVLTERIDCHAMNWNIWTRRKWYLNWWGVTVSGMLSRLNPISPTRLGQGHLQRVGRQVVVSQDSTERLDSLERRPRIAVSGAKTNQRCLSRRTEEVRYLMSMRLGCNNWKISINYARLTRALRFFWAPLPVEELHFLLILLSLKHDAH